MTNEAKGPCPRYPRHVLRELIGRVQRRWASPMAHRNPSSAHWRGNLKRMGCRRVLISYFGTASIQAYGVNVEPLANETAPTLLTSCHDGSHDTPIRRPSVAKGET
jgi:hypothetical protein